MERLLKFQLFCAFVLVCFDVFLLPQIIGWFLSLQGVIGAWSLSLWGWIDYFGPAFPIWIWCQFFAVAAIIYIFISGRGFVNISDSDIPPAAGHGQHGTSRWMTREELERCFHVRRF